MLSVEECKFYLSDIDMTEDQIIALRDALYVLVERILDEELKC